MGQIAARFVALRRVYIVGVLSVRPETFGDNVAVPPGTWSGDRRHCDCRSLWYERRGGVGRKSTLLSGCGVVVDPYTI